MPLENIFAIALFCCKNRLLPFVKHAFITYTVFHSYIANVLYSCTLGHK